MLAPFMNLGFILFDYFPFGGLQRDCLRIAQLCVERGHRVTLFARTWQGDKPSGINVELLGRRGFTNTSRNRYFLKQLVAQLARHNFDGVVGFNKVPGLDVYYGADPCYLAKVARLKPAWYRWLPRFKHYAALERSVFRRGSATRILLLKESEIPLYQQFYGTERERLHVLPPGVLRRSFTESERLETRRRLRQDNGWKPDEKLLLMVGSGFRIKGLDRAITALASLDRQSGTSARLIVIGQNAPGVFAKQAGKLGVAERVHFLGGRHDVPNWMLAADLLIHPAYSENTGTILVEAITNGLPVLATDVCGYAFHVTKAMGGIVLPSPFSQDQCNRTLAEMLASPTMKEWGANGLAYAAKEDLYSCHERAVDIIEQTIQQKPHRVSTPSPTLRA